MKRAVIIILILIGVTTIMSLWDTDKNSNDRLSPQLNAKDGVSSRMAHGTTGFTLKDENSDGTLGKLVFKDGKLSLVKEDNTVVNITGDGIKIAQPGFDASTTDDSNLVLTSELNSFKIVQSGTASLTVSTILSAGTTEQVTVAHNLGFKPAIQVYVTVPSGWSGSNANQLTQLPTMLIDSGGAGVAGSGAVIYLYIQASVDDNNLYLKVTNPTGNSQAGFGNPWVFKYYLLVETAS